MIIAQTGYSTGCSIEKPMRLILKSENNEFVSRFQTIDGMEFYGHYSRKDVVFAKSNFIDRVNEHNKMYPVGNPSYVSKIEWL